MERPASTGPNAIDLQNSYLTGAQAELRVAAFYVDQGFQVYTPVVRNGPVDLVVEKPDGWLFRVQVKTASWIKSGAYSYLQARIRSANRAVHAQSGYYDTVMVVFGDELWEIPARDIHSSNICLRGTRPERKEEAWDHCKVR